MFNNFSLNDDEIMKIINKYKPLFVKNSMINFRFDEDLYQELVIKVFTVLSKNRDKKK